MGPTLRTTARTKELDVGYQKKSEPAYAAMVPECKRWDICRTEAFRLARLGLIDTFAIGRKRYVWIASLESLPARLHAIQGGQS